MKFLYIFLLKCNLHKEWNQDELLEYSELILLLLDMNMIIIKMKTMIVKEEYHYKIFLLSTHKGKMFIEAFKNN